MVPSLLSARMGQLEPLQGLVRAQGSSSSSSLSFLLSVGGSIGPHLEHGLMFYPFSPEP